MATTKFTIKLLVDKKANKVLFAEAGKDVVDFLLGLFFLPLGSVIKLLNKDRMVGCLGNLYGSIGSLNETHFLQDQKKNPLENPESAFPIANCHLLMPENKITNRKYYKCSSKSHHSCNNYCSSYGSYNCPHNYVTDGPGIACPNYQCRKAMSTEINFIASSTNNEASIFKGGFVKEVVTYMVFDDLVVSPMSTISTVTVLNKFKVDIGSLDEKVVVFGIEEGLEMLKSSLESKEVLSHVFLGKNTI